MKANWKARNKQYNDRQKGEIFDVGIGYGKKLKDTIDSGGYLIRTQGY